MKKVLQLLLLFPFLLSAQTKTLDSIALEIKNAKHDSVRCELMVLFGDNLTDPDAGHKQYEAVTKFCETKLKSNTLSAKEKFVFTKYHAMSFHKIAFLFYAQNQFPQALEYFEKACKIFETLKMKAELASTLFAMGAICRMQGNFDDATRYLEQSLKTSQAINARHDMINALAYLGDIAKARGNVPKALEYFNRGLKLAEEEKDKKKIAVMLSYLGAVYEYQDNETKALEMYTKSLEIHEEQKNKQQAAYSLNNIALIYKDKCKTGEASSDINDPGSYLSKAISNFKKSIRFLEEVKDKEGLSTALTNLAVIYNKFGVPGTQQMQKEIAQKASSDTALKYLARSLEIAEETGQKRMIAATLTETGTVYFEKKEYQKALACAIKSIQISKAMGHAANTRNAAWLLSRIYKAQGKHKAALENYELFIQMRDSLTNEDNKKRALKNMLNYEYEKKAAADSVKNAEEQKVKDARLSAQNATLKQEKFQRYSLLVGLLIVLCGLAFVINRFRVTNKQKKIIEEQKIIVDEAFEKLHEKNKEVMDSIYYARRIQRALITSEHYINKNLNELKRQSHEGKRN